MKKLTENQHLLIIQILFILGLSIFYISKNIFPSLEMLIAISIALLIWRAKQRNLLMDLLPLFIMLLTFQSLRSFVDNLTPAHIHILDMIAYEKALFNGIIPAAFFQKAFSNQPYTPILTEILNMFYMSHFIVPVITAIIVWYQKKEHYWYFIIGLIALTYAGFITYVTKLLNKKGITHLLFSKDYYFIGSHNPDINIQAEIFFTEKYKVSCTNKIFSNYWIELYKITCQ